MKVAAGVRIEILCVIFHCVGTVLVELHVRHRWRCGQTIKRCKAMIEAYLLIVECTQRLWDAFVFGETDDGLEKNKQNSDQNIASQKATPIYIV